MAKYLLLQRCEDNVHADIMSEAQLKKWLEGEEGEGRDNYKFLKNAPNIEYMPEYSAFIFKGEVVIPKPVESVTKWEV